MKIRYLHQSGFALEMGNVLLVFDCWKFPQAGQQEGGRGYLCKKDLEGYERVYIFVSHIHGDHFNRRIFEWADERVVYVLDRAVPAPPGICAKKLSSGESLYEGDMRVAAHPSTDLGISFQVYAKLSNTRSFGLDGFSVNLKSCYKITLAVKCFLPLLEKFKEEDNRSTNPNKVSYNRMLLISRIVYFFGYTDNPKFLDNDESISGIWTSYKDKEWTTVGANFR